MRWGFLCGAEALSRGVLLSRRVVELVLGRPVKARLDPRVLPQAQNDVGHFFGHGALLDGVCKVHELPGIVLQGRQMLSHSERDECAELAHVSCGEPADPSGRS